MGYYGFTMGFYVFPWSFGRQLMAGSLVAPSRQDEIDRMQDDQHQSIVKWLSFICSYFVLVNKRRRVRRSVSRVLSPQPSEDERDG